MPRKKGGEKKAGRKVDERKTARVLAKIRRATAADAEAGEGADGEKKLTAWEREFAQSVEERLEKYGSAFRDASKGNLEEPLSARQAAKLREVVKAAQGKRKGLKRSGPIKAKAPAKPGTKSGAGLKRKSSKAARGKWTPRVRHIEDD
ncbi:MAG: hypothetical protein PVI23_13945 [Maricaulaceae bacterium]|jgi:hypothetical protein